MKSPAQAQRVINQKILGLLTCQLCLGAKNSPTAMAVTSGKMISRWPDSSELPTISTTTAKVGPWVNRLL